MTVAPLLNVSITSQDSVIEVVHRDDADFDEVFVTTNLVLAGDIDAAQDATLLLPMSGEQTERPLS